MAEPRTDFPRSAGLFSGGTRLRDVHQWLWWLFVAALVMGVGSLLRNFGELLFTMPSVLGVGVLLGVPLAAVLLWILHAVDRFQSRPVNLTVATLAWGAIAATGTAVVANSALSAPLSVLGLSSWSAAFSAPIHEETFKLIGVVIVLFLARRRGPRPMDGLVWGAMVGIGFEVFENLVYMAQNAVVDPNSDVGGALQIGLVRSAIGFGLHPMLTAITGFAMATALAVPGIARRRRVLIAVGGFAFSWVLHFLWDAPVLGSATLAPADLGALVVKYAVLISGFVFVLRKAWRTERVWINTKLAAAPADVITAEEREAIVNGAVAGQFRADIRRRERRRAQRNYRLLQHAQVVLVDLLRDRPESDPVVVAQRSAIEHYRALVQPALAVFDQSA